MAVSMISLDLDGTLMLDDKSVSPRTIRAIADVRAAGVPVILNSGRMPESVIGTANVIGARDPAICYNGALTCDLRDGTVFGALPLAGAAARAIVRETERIGLYCQAFWGGGYYYEVRTAYSDAYAAKAGVVGQATGEKLSACIPGDVYKLLFIGEPGEALAHKDDLERAFGADAAFLASSKTFLECVSKRANKGTALVQLAARYGVAAADVMAFGDEQNDVPMLEAVGYGYAMANASPAVRARARYTAPSNMEDGVAQVLEDFLRRGLFRAPEGPRA